MFKFTFRANESTFNPFAAQAEERERVQQAIAPQTILRKLPAPPPRPIPPTAEDHAPKPRKRGWTPVTSSSSAPVSQYTETTGWIDTPSRYLEAASQSHRNERETEFNSDLPQAKRRRTLTDSILSTALSAALIGTTVGMTAYRMWRDRGKTGDTVSNETILDPPPPYEKDEWVDVAAKPVDRSPRAFRKPRPIARKPPRSRMVPIAMSPRARTPPSQSPFHVASSSTSIPVEQNELESEEQGDLDEQMDWMSDKIRKLIEDGQKALGKEVVVMSDNPDDKDGAVDDGQEGWEEVNNGQKAGPSFSTPSNFRGTRKLPSSYAQPTHSPTWSSHTCRNDRAPHGQSRPLRTGFLGRPGEDAKDVKVLYEADSPSLSIPNPLAKELSEDESSKSLSERARKIRQAYQIP